MILRRFCLFVFLVVPSNLYQALRPDITSKVDGRKTPSYLLAYLLATCPHPRGDVSNVKTSLAVRALCRSISGVAASAPCTVSVSAGTFIVLTVL